LLTKISSINRELGTACDNAMLMIPLLATNGKRRAS